MDTNFTHFMLREVSIKMLLKDQIAQNELSLES